MRATREEGTARTGVEGEHNVGHAVNGKGHGWRTREADAYGLRKAMGLFPTGVTVVTTGCEERAEGMTANAVVSVSLDPLLILISVRKEARLNSRIKEEGYYAINILAADQEHLSRFFSSSERSSGLSTVSSLRGGCGVTGAPLAAGSLATIECELEAVYPGGDHDLLLGRVVAIQASDTPEEDPLVFYKGGYRTLEVPALSASRVSGVSQLTGYQGNDSSATSSRR